MIPRLFKRNPLILLGIVASILFFGTGCITTSESQGASSSVLPMYGVLLDPGHGGEPEEAASQAGEGYGTLGRTARQGYLEECYGAINESGYKEKAATLAVAKKIKGLLEEAGIPVDMTRSTDRYLSLNERVATALSPKYRNWVFVSIHFNRSSAKQRATSLQRKYLAPRGFEIYVVPPPGARSSMGSRASSGYVTINDTPNSNRLLAKNIQSHLGSIPGIRDRGIKEAWFVVLRGSPMPALLIEGGFLSNPEEGMLISTDSYQWMLARAIVSGIQDYKTSSTTMLVKGKPNLNSRFAMNQPLSLRDDPQSTFH